MKLHILQFVSLLFIALTLGPALAHLLELPAKMNLSLDEYLTVQKIYRGWALLGIVVFGALLSTLLLVVKMWKDGMPKVAFAFTTFLCLAATQAIFWIFTFPANKITNNWTVLPENWLALRMQWEYSHAAGAVLNLLALFMLILCIVADRRQVQ